MGSLQFPNMGMGLRLAAFSRRSSAKMSIYNAEKKNQITLKRKKNTEIFRW